MQRVLVQLQAWGDVVRMTLNLVEISLLLHAITLGLEDGRLTQGDEHSIAQVQKLKLRLMDAIKRTDK